MMSAPYCNTRKAQKKKYQSRTLQESLLLNLNFDDEELNSESYDIKTSERSFLTPPSYMLQDESSVTVNTPLPNDCNPTEENILKFIEPKITRLVFDIDKIGTEHHALLTGFCGDNWNRPNSVFGSERLLHVEFGPVYEPSMDGLPYIPLNVEVKRVVMIIIPTGNQQMYPSFSYSTATSPDTTFVVCRLPSDLSCSKYMIAPDTIYTHSVSLYLKFSGNKSINHKFDILKADKKLYRKYLILRALTCNAHTEDPFWNFQMQTIFPDTQNDKDELEAI